MRFSPKFITRSRVGRLPVLYATFPVSLSTARRRRPSGFPTPRVPPRPSRFGVERPRLGTETFCFTRVLQEYLKWRDPDSNPGHPRSGGFPGRGKRPPGSLLPRPRRGSGLDRNPHRHTGDVKMALQLSGRYNGPDAVPRASRWPRPSRKKGRAEGVNIGRCNGAISSPKRRVSCAVGAGEGAR